MYGLMGWVGLPGKPIVIDRKVETDERGKIRYIPVVEIENARIREAFGRAIWAAVLSRHPELQAEEAVS